MTIQELIEFAVLDVLGLLDVDERRGYERAFAACAPAVQSMIRREQTRLSNIDRLLPQVEAPVHLRAQVLEAVRRSMEAEEAGLADAVAPWTPPDMVESRRVSHLWRATALASVAAALVLGATTMWLKGEIQNIDSVLDSNTLSDQTLLSLGPKFKEYLYNERVRHVTFSGDGASRGEAVLMLDPEAGKAYLAYQNLPPTPAGKPYTLVIINEEGAPGETIGDPFRSDGRFTGREVLRVTVRAGTRFAIMAAGDDGKSQPVLTAQWRPES